MWKQQFYLKTINQKKRKTQKSNKQTNNKLIIYIFPKRSQINVSDFSYNSFTITFTKFHNLRQLVLLIAASNFYLQQHLDSYLLLVTYLHPVHQTTSTFSFSNIPVINSDHIRIMFYFLTSQHTITLLRYKI